MDKARPTHLARLEELDSLRGLACLVVVVHHFFLMTGPANPSKFERFMFEGPLRLFVAGHSAVIFFFVLSGFVLSLPYVNKSGSPYYVFLVRRVFRIYVPYVVALLFACLGVLLYGGVPMYFNPGYGGAWYRPLNLQALLNHLLFLGNYDPNEFNIAFWSLVHEMRISLVLPWVVISPFRLGLISALLLSVLSELLTRLFPAYANIYISLHYLGIFLIGIWLARNYEKYGKWFSGIGFRGELVIIGLSLMLWGYGTVARRSGFVSVADYVVALGSVGLILSGVNSNWFKIILKKSVCRFLGKISYSVYLIHGTVLYFLIFLTARHLGRLPFLPIYLLLVFVLSVFFFFLVEQPANRAGKALSSRLMKLQQPQSLAALDER